MDDNNDDGAVGRRVYPLQTLNPAQPFIRVNAIAVGAITMQQNGVDLFQVILHTHSGDYATGNFSEAEARSIADLWVKRVEKAPY